jgi:hypothetical protein
MKGAEIKTKEYAILSQQSEVNLFTQKLEKEIALTFFSQKLQKVALARNPDNEMLEKLVAEINVENSNEAGLIDIRFIGGVDCEESKMQLLLLMKSLQQIDSGRDILNIISFDVCERVHPDSFMLDCLQGNLIAIEFGEYQN